MDLCKRMVDLMGQRDDLFHQFGPILFEAFMLMTLDAINALRVKAGLPAYTKQQVMNEISNHLSTLELYDWMKTGP